MSENNQYDYARGPQQRPHQADPLRGPQQRPQQSAPLHGPPQRPGLDGAAALQEPTRAPLRVAPSAAAPAPPEPDIAEPLRNPAAQTDETESGTKRGGRRSSNNAPPPPLPAAPTGARQHPLVTAPAEAQPHHHREITRDLLFRPTKRPPQSGWRRAIHRMTGGGVNPGESGEDVRRRQLIDRVNQPVRGDYKIAVLSLKGGVGKTTTTVSLGSTFASLRGDHVVAIDANPDLGTLGGRIPSQTSTTVRDLLDDRDRIHRYSDVRAFTSQAPSRLEVLASERDPHKAEAFSEDDYRAAVATLENFYNLILTDCGTGLTHSAMRGVLDTADALVLVSSPALDGAQSADATLNWLTAQGYGHLVERTVVVISASRPGSSGVRVSQLVEHFADVVRAVQVIPFDAHLAEGSEVDLERMSRAARDAFVDLAALVADDFPVAAGRHHGPVQGR